MEKTRASNKDAYEKKKDTYETQMENISNKNISNNNISSNNISKKISSSAKRFKEELDKTNIKTNIIEMSESTRTSKDAANAIGCSIGQIAKSLVFMTEDTNEAVLIITSGNNRVNEEKVSQIIGHQIKKANPKFVKLETGFAIGGVPPFGHRKEIKTYIDRDLLNYDEIWSAAGNPHAVFEISPTKLLEITKAIVISVQ